MFFFRIRAEVVATTCELAHVDVVGIFYSSVGWVWVFIFILAIYLFSYTFFCERMVALSSGKSGPSLGILCHTDMARGHFFFSSESRKVTKVEKV